MLLRVHSIFEGDEARIKDMVLMSNMSQKEKEISQGT